MNTSKAAEGITASVIENVESIAERCNASAVFVYLDALEDVDLSLHEDLNAKVFYVTKTSEQEAEPAAKGRQVLRVPDVLSAMHPQRSMLSRATSRTAAAHAPAQGFNAVSRPAA